MSQENLKIQSAQVEEQLQTLKDSILRIFDHSQTQQCQTDLERTYRYLNYVQCCLDVAHQIWWPAQDNREEYKEIAEQYESEKSR